MCGPQRNMSDGNICCTDGIYYAADRDIIIEVPNDRFTMRTEACYNAVPIKEEVMADEINKMLIGLIKSIKSTTSI